ncbi:MAG: sigma-70 family RNA polymerase sigma factor [Saprospiraceae bacterium]|nr:sigma-70 family RNA polymerase sigma factor [Saprospiraceae bacterium]
MIPTLTLKREEQLVIAYQKTKCNKAFGELYSLFYSQLFDYTCKIANDSEDAFDITQEAFIKAAQEMDKLRNPITFRFWLFRIAKNMCMKKYRKMAKESCDSYEEDVVSQDYDITDAIEKDELLERLALILSTLSKEDQDLLLAKYSDGKSIKEIMEETSLGSSAIKMKLMRARSKVVTAMNKVS